MLIYTGSDAYFDLLIVGPLRIILGYISYCAILSFLTQYFFFVFFSDDLLNVPSIFDEKMEIYYTFCH
jgi:hypothetical protein